MRWIGRQRVWIVPLLIIVGIFFVGPEVFAQGGESGAGGTSGPNNDSRTESLQWMTTRLSLLLNLLYLLLWPLLVVAGMSLDNSFVYGSLFGLDVPLWRLWNLMKNFANFGLGFFVLYQILLNVLQFKGTDGFVQDTIKKTLIAGVGIQASRFIVAALIDLSTILTFAVGGMPLTIMNSVDTKLANKPILGISSTVKLSDMGSVFDPKSAETFYYTYGKKKLSPCLLNQGYIVGNQITGSSFEDDLCVVMGEAVKYNPKTTKECAKYLQTLDDSKSVDALKACITKGEIVVWDKTLPATQTALSSAEDDLGDLGMTLAKLSQNSQGYVGPLVTLYATILDFGGIQNTANDKTLAGTALEFIIKLAVGLALVAPLVALAVVLLIRIGLLWLLIAFSPIFWLLYAFGREGKIPFPKGISKMEEILSLIFAPIAPVLAVSLSVVFLTVITEQLQPRLNGSSGFMSALGIEKCSGTQQVGNKCRDFGPSQLTLETASKDVGTSLFPDFIPWLIINMIAIGLLRTILFTALKAPHFAQGVVSSIQNLGERTFGSIPIVPLPGGNVGIGALTSGRVADAYTRPIEASLDRQAYNALPSFLKSETPAQKEEKNMKVAEKIISNLTFSNLTKPEDIQTQLTQAASNVEGGRDLLNIVAAQSELYDKLGEYFAANKKPEWMLKRFEGQIIALKAEQADKLLATKLGQAFLADGTPSLLDKVKGADWSGINKSTAKVKPLPSGT